MQVDTDHQSDSSSGIKRKIPDAAPSQSDLTDSKLPEPPSRSALTWVSVHHKTTELDQFSFPIPDIPVVFTLVPETFHLPKDFITSIDFARPKTDKPLSIARLQFMEWIKIMSPDAELTTQQTATVAQYVNLLYMETFQLLKDLYSADLNFFVQAITLHHATFDLDQNAPNLQEYYHTLDTDAWGQLVSSTSDILAYLESDITLDTISYTDALLQFAQGIDMDQALTASLQMQVNHETP